MADWIGVGQVAAKLLLETLATYLTGQFKWKANMKSALKELQYVLSPIQVELERAEKRELGLDGKPALAKWIWQLRDAIEEAGDVLDDLEYQQLERQILERDTNEKVFTAPVVASAASSSSSSSSSSRFKSKLFNFFKVHAFGCSASSFKHSCIHFGKRALLLDPTLDNLNAAVANLKLVSAEINVLTTAITESPLRFGSGNNSRTANKRETTPDELPADEVVGRDKDKSEVLKLLKESGGDGQGSDRIFALTISGAGGVGKTTLAQSVYHDNTLNFPVKMWVCVSNNNDDMLVLMRKAIETATRKAPSATTSLASLKKELEDIVKSKKCLLVLDDVWDNQSNQSPLQWENFIKILPDHADKGSRIIITSRKGSIAEIVLQSLPVKNKTFPLGCLQEDESLLLFNRHAYSRADDAHTQELLKPVGKVIARKCGGFPLALKMMGGLLNANLNYEYWCSISERNILNLGQGMADVKEVLKLSYQCLPSNLQSCFRVCSLFPQDYEFEEDELIKIWIGLGCIQQRKDENTRSVEDIGQDCLDELVRRSFFVYDSDAESYTLHDLLHDLARDVSKDECLRVEGNNGNNKKLPNTLRHLFVDRLNPNLVTQISSLKRLRTLALFDDDYGDLSDILKHLESLHALFIRGINMSDLMVIKHLKHLRLFHMKVSVLNKPLEPLYKLYQLQSLICEGNTERSEVQRIECGGIGNLVRLRHLVLPPTIFDQITELRHLLELQEVELRLKNDNAIKLSDLRNLNSLRHLIINNEREETKFEDVKETILVEKEQLETLQLQWIQWDPDNHKKIYDLLRPRENSKIKSLKVRNYSGSTAPMWMDNRYLPFLTYLELSKCKNLQHLPPLGELQSLESLKLSEINGVKKAGAEFFGSGGDVKGFPSLLQLIIDGMECWEEWTEIENKRWFACLETLDISQCPQLKALPALPLSLKRMELRNVGLTSLPTPLFDMTMTNCNCKLCTTSSSLAESYDQTHCKMLPSLESLKIISCGSLTSLPDEMPSSLTELILRGCPQLVMLPNKMPSSLTELTLWDCPQLVMLPNKMPSSLTSLQIIDCRLLESLPDEMPSSLMSLEIKSGPLFWNLYRKDGPRWPNIPHICLLP